jgi:RNA ligase (TIGR02306 family)
MSSEHDVVVTRLEGITKHPNADTLSVVTVDGRPVVIRTGEFAEGDLAVYIPIDTMVPLLDPRFQFLRERNSTADGYSRIKAVRLRGVFSMGLLAKPEPTWAVGDVVNEALGTRVYEPASDRNLSTGGDNEPDPGFLPCYTDIESIRKWRHVFTPDEEVVVTEKIHGANARYVWREGRLVWVADWDQAGGRQEHLVASGQELGSCRETSTNPQHRGLWRSVRPGPRSQVRCLIRGTFRRL